MLHKILSTATLETWLKEQKANNAKIVFTNGCFDLVHVGHIKCLQEAKTHGSVLFVGVNDDASVARLKGDTRPIHHIDDRMRMLAALETVDAVIPFHEDNPLRLIETIGPDILVKGGDYSIDQIIGAEYVKENGGEVVIIPLEEGYSSTNLIRKIKNLPSEDV